jgi:hypothetical protein
MLSTDGLQVKLRPLTSNANPINQAVKLGPTELKHIQRSLSPSANLKLTNIQSAVNRTNFNSPNALKKLEANRSLNERVKTSQEGIQPI